MIILNAQGKFIETKQIEKLFTQGERFSDKIGFLINKINNDVDVSGCTFIIRTCAYDGCMTETLLSKEIQDEMLLLTWNVSEAVTAVPGKLCLELIGSQEENVIIKYKMPPVLIKEAVMGTNIPVPDVVDAKLALMNEILEEISAVAEAVKEDGTVIQEIADARTGSILQRTFTSLAARLSADFDLCITQGELERALSSVTTAYTTADNVQNALLLTAMGLTKGSKNLLKNTASSTTKNGLTFTVNDDGSVTVNGTATADTEITVRNMTLLANTDYILSGCPENDTDDWQYRIYAINTSTWAIVGADYGYGSGYALRTGNNTGWSFRIQIKSGCTADDLVFYPMLRYAVITSSEFEAYTPGLQEQIYALKAAVISLGGTVSTLEYEVPDAVTENMGNITETDNVITENEEITESETETESSSVNEGSPDSITVVKPEVSTE